MLENENKKSSMLKKNIILILVIITTLDSSSQVTYLQTIYDREGGIEALKYPDDIQADSEGNIYVIGYNTLTHLKWDDSLLTFSYVGKIDANTYPNLINTDEIKSSPDGRFYYLAGNQELFVFSKIDSTGELDYKQSIQNSDSIMIGYAGSSNIVISADMEYFYFSSKYASNWSLTVCSFDSLTGIPTYKSKITDIKDINSIAASDSFVYVSAYGYNDTALYVYKRTDETDNLIPVQQLLPSDGIFSPTKLVLSHDNHFLYVYDSIKISIFNIDSLSGKISLEDKVILNNYFSGIWNAIKILISKDNRYLYLAGGNTISVFSRDTSTGKLTFIQLIKQDIDDFPGFNTLSSITISDGGKWLFALDKYNNAFMLFKISIKNGRLTYLKTIVNEDGKIKGLSSAIDILVSKNNKHVYTLANYGNNTFALFNRSSDGCLEFIKNLNYDELELGLGSTHTFTLNPNDRYVYISSKESFVLRVLRREPETGNLSLLAYHNNSENDIEEGISDIAITNDARNLYAVTHTNIVSYKIDSVDSDLNYISKIAIEENGSGGLIGSKRLITSHDGNNVYAGSYSIFYPDGIAVYSRNSEDGNLEHIQNLTSGKYSINYNQPFSLVLSPDNNFLYTAGKSILIIKRNQDDGKLTIIDEINYEDIGLEHTYSISHVAISKDGKSLVAITNGLNDAILSFYRNVDDGKLILKQVNYISSGLKSVFSEDQKNLYLISPESKSLMSYKTNVPLGLKKTIEGCKGDTIEISVDEGYNYLWSTGDTTNVINTMDDNQYTLYVTDTLGREGWDTTKVVLHQLPEIQLFIDTINTSKDTTYIYSIVREGSYPYSYLWNDSSTSRNLTVITSVIEKGDFIYSLSVTDINGCKNTDSIVLTIDKSDIMDVDEQNNLLVYPTIFTNFLIVEFKYYLEKDFNIRIFDMSASIQYQSKLKPEKITKIDLSQLRPGVYIIELSNDSFKKRIRIIKNE